MSSETVVHRHPRGSDEEERVAGKISYLSVLERLHRELAPTFYLEIGVRFGASLVLAKAPAIGVDPEPELKQILPATTQVIAATSDAFFEAAPADLRPDFAFIDGLHLFEFALRDFINIEACAAPGAVVVVDDVAPNHPSQADRDRHTRVWTGDVWRLGAALARYRPDLELHLIDTSPTGLIVIANLDRANRTLAERFDEIVADPAYSGPPPAAVLERAGALDPEGEPFERVVESLKARRAG